MMSMVSPDQLFDFFLFAPTLRQGTTAVVVYGEIEI
jgi:hypothetical protein